MIQSLFRLIIYILKACVKVHEEKIVFKLYQEFFDLLCDNELVHFDIVYVGCCRWGRGKDLQGRAEAGFLKNQMHNEGLLGA